MECFSLFKSYIFIWASNACMSATPYEENRMFIVFIFQSWWVKQEVKAKKSHECKKKYLFAHMLRIFFRVFNTDQCLKKTTWFLISWFWAFWITSNESVSSRLFGSRSNILGIMQFDITMWNVNIWLKNKRVAFKSTVARSTAKSCQILQSFLRWKN